MKRIALLVWAVVLFASCAPVLNRQLMKEGVRDVPFGLMKASPDAYKGRLYILGGVVVGTHFTEKGSQVEVLAVPVDSLGYLEESEESPGRFIALYPVSQGLLDPLVYRKGREITLAGEFVEVLAGKIDEMEYVYPVFKIRQIYLWKEERDQYRSNYYYPYYRDPFFYPSPFLFDPWGRPYRGPYWPPPPW